MYIFVLLLYCRGSFYAVLTISEIVERPVSKNVMFNSREIKGEISKLQNVVWVNRVVCYLVVGQFAN